jgi:hypothetical protein
MKTKRIGLMLVIWNLALVGLCLSQEPFSRHDPKRDPNLSPARNNLINPLFNSSINPKFNWNLNPKHNKLIDPISATDINPQFNPDLNPVYNKIYNPMFANSLHPKNPRWSGRYLFDKDDNLIGYVSVASQNILLCFDTNGEWTCYFVKTSTGTYNRFTLEGEWSGQYFCSDGSQGFNLFAATGEWTGQHMK